MCSKRRGTMSESCSCPECDASFDSEHAFKSHYANSHSRPYPWQLSEEKRNHLRRWFEDPDRWWSRDEMAEELGLSNRELARALQRNDFERRATQDYARGPDHPEWIDQSLQKYGEYFRRQALRARERDEHRCQWCQEVTDEEHVERYNFGLDVHHIEPVDSFRTDEGISKSEAHCLENLVAMCRPCHRAAERLQPWQVREVLSLSE